MQSGKTPSVHDYYKDLEAPDVASMEVQLEQLVQQGALTPEEAQTVLLERSQMNNISTDPDLKKAQMDALLGLQEISDEGGLTAMDKSKLNQIQTQENAQARGQREAILQNAQQRGISGSGLELMSQMKNQQDSATRASARDLDVAALAQERALQALIDSGQLAGNIQSQDFNQQAQIAGANDAISRFNAQNQQNQINQNVQARNQAQVANLGMQQSVADQNTALRNQQQQHNKGLIQQNYENQLKKRGGQSGVAQANAQAAGQNSQNRANANNQMIGTAATILGTVYGGPAGGAAANAAVNGVSQKMNGGLVMGDPSDGDTMPHMLQPGEHVVRKEDVPRVMKAAHTDENGEFDVAGFLDDITGNKYGYKKGSK